MARYIEVEELISYIKSTMDMQDLYLPIHFITAIKNVKTADVQEVKHGKWIDEQLDKFRKWKSTCSVCGWYGVSNYDSYVDIYDFEYCPNCGAKMDKE